jgi:hypothetical protein
MSDPLGIGREEAMRAKSVTVTAPIEKPRTCSECAYTPKQSDDGLRYCKRHKIPVRPGAGPCAFAKSRKEPKPGQGTML